MTDTREALFALVDATLRPFQVDPKRGPSDAVGAITDAILAEFDVTERASMDPGFEDHEAYCHLQHGMGGPCSCKDAPVVLDSPHGLGCLPGCGHDRSEAAVPDSEDVRAYRIETERGKGTAIQIGGRRAGKTQALAERVADEVMKRGGSATVISLPSVEDVARACGDPGSVTPRREGESVPRWSARAVLALLPGRSEAEVRQDEAERIAAWVTADEPSDTLVLLADALRRGDHRG